MTTKQSIKRMIFLQDRRILAYEKKYTKIVRSALLEQVEYAIDNRGNIPELPMYNALRGLYETVLDDFLRLQYNMLNGPLVKKDMSFFLNTWADWIKNYILNDMVTHVEEINKTTQKRIREAIATGFEKGMTWGDIAELIQEKVGNEVSLSRAYTIARTETVNAANMAKEKSGDAFEEETGETLYKLWIHRFAKEPRSWHQALDNDIAIPKNDLFRVIDPLGPEEFMSRPHSPGASARNTINCSCQVIFISERMARNLALNK